MSAVTVGGCATGPAAEVTAGGDAASPTAAATADAAATSPASSAAQEAEGAEPVQPTASADPASDRAVDVLATLPVKGRAAKTGYSRTEFGRGWKDPDHNGCDARNDVLARDLVDTTRKGDCTVLTGTLHDPYTGGDIAFTRGAKTSEAVQIDHVVALSDAWQKGAQQLSADMRVDLANDPLELIAVDGPTNTSKSDGDAATWLPPDTGFRCEYVARQIAVKASYGLWVTEAERDAMGGVLAGCPDQRVGDSTLHPRAR
ncbi:HNH endonuclease family protein [Pseudoclavibacter caeni]|uniref:HNH endonuclease family protein n=1 Tax=Pseudoclavibacter caeni TaxID=908846 RepID=UPI00182BCA8F|nr:HNH endonuclease family protein [Pseudoclavibacter caeni]NYJ97441.1 hypothetical protein [Pseudoclavibacter caeni]